MQTTIPDFQAACNEVGVPVNDECVFYDVRFIAFYSKPVATPL